MQSSSSPSTATTTTTQQHHQITAGETFVKRLENHWNIIHYNSNVIIQNVNQVDNRMIDLHKRVINETKQFKLMETTLQSTLPPLNHTVTNMFHQVEQLKNGFDYLHLVLLYAQSKQLESDFNKWKRKEEEDLKLFTRKKSQELSVYAQQLEKEKIQRDILESQSVKKLQSENDLLKQKLLLLQKQMQLQSSTTIDTTTTTTVNNNNTDQSVEPIHEPSNEQQSITTQVPLASEPVEQSLPTSSDDSQQQQQPEQEQEQQPEQQEQSLDQESDQVEENVEQESIEENSFN